MNLVYHIISRQYPTFIHDEDVIQSGMLGLCKAAESFDPKKGLFSTYAGRCIRNEINQEFIKRKPFSQTVSLDTKISEEGTLQDVLVGEILNIPVEKVRKIMRIIKIKRGKYESQD